MLLVALASTQAFAQANFAGVWSAGYVEDWPDRFPGPELGDYAGLPLNDADRHRAQSWSASILSLPDYQCRVHPSDYANSFADIRIWDEINTDTQELIAIHLQHFAWSTQRTIWMDGRPHPPEFAQHTSMGFSTGEWQGQILKVTTTHLKEGWLRRNGVARSDSATVTEHFIRHGNHLTWNVFVQDPKYLEEPFFRNRDYTLAETGGIGAYPCESVVEVLLPEGYFPHYLPGQNPFLIEYARNHGIPFEAAMGGAATMYPEYAKKLKELPRP
ncbi:MAG TPA: hypothetical protein VJA26_10810 [Gammaproteobacteria bacterium]|nr:hypothetical protein [Gammaproteobacteria bacterium]